MKKIILILLTVLALDNVSGQYYSVPYVNAGMNPGGLNKDPEYPVGGGIATGWATWIGGNKATPAWSTRKKLPFTFNFNGKDYDSVWVSTSGVVTFSQKVGKAPLYKNTMLPDTSIPENSVCIRGILSAGANSSFANVVTKSFGNTGSRQFWITYSAYNELNLGSSAFIWVSIVLEEKTNNIYFVDERKAPATATKLTMGLQIDDTTAYTIAGSPNINLSSGADNLLTDNTYYKMSKGIQPVNNAEGMQSNLNDYLAMTQAPFVISAKFKNIGTAAIKSADINYSINNGTPVTAAASSINIAKNGTATVTSPTTWNPSVEGSYTVSVWLSNINGNVDEEPMNDTVVKIVSVVPDFAVRVPLHEVFTSSTCVPCVAGNKNTDENIFPLYAATELTVIKYQMSWPGTGDPYTTPEGNVRRGVYSVNSIPNMQVDGGWNGNAASYSTALFEQFRSKPSFIKIDATHTINFKKISVNVKITPLSNFNNPNLRLFIAVCEKVTYKNIKSNGETEFHHVLKKMLPDANGTSLGTLTRNTDKTFPAMNYNVPGDYRLPIDGQVANIINVNTENSLEELNDCEVVVFVQDIVTKEVYQSANSTGTVLSVDDIKGLGNAIAVYPNPSVDGTTNVKFTVNNAENININVYNTLGQVVETISSKGIVAGTNTLQINTSRYAKGIYTIQIDGDGFSSSEKFSIQ